MAFNRIRVIDTGSISAGSYADFEQAEEIDLVLKRIFIVEAGGNSVNNVTLTFNVGDKPYFRPDVSAAIFDPSNPLNPELNIKVEKGVKVSGRVTNNEAADRQLYIHLVYESG